MVVNIGFGMYSQKWIYTVLINLTKLPSKILKFSLGPSLYRKRAKSLFYFLFIHIFFNIYKQHFSVLNIHILLFCYLYC